MAFPRLCYRRGSFALARNIFRPLVITEAQVDGMPHLARACPFGDLYLSNKRWLDPGSDGLVLYFRGKRRPYGLQLHELAVKHFKCFVGEARADMAI
jgi:hypothetical protein